MARPTLYPEKLLVKFAAGTVDRIDAALREAENRSDLVREAVEDLLRRREARQRRAGRKPG